MPSVKLLRNTGAINGHVTLRLANLRARGYAVVVLSCAEWRGSSSAAPEAAAGSVMAGWESNPFANAEDAQERLLVEQLAPHLAALGRWQPGEPLPVWQIEEQIALGVLQGQD